VAITHEQADDCLSIIGGSARSSSAAVPTKQMWCCWTLTGIKGPQRN